MTYSSPLSIHSVKAPTSPSPSSSQGLVRQSSQLPVTALSFAPLSQQKLLLAAEDSVIKIYDASSFEVVAHVNVFAEQTVHGISVCGSRVLAWGNKYVAFFKLDGLESSDQKGGIEVLRVDAPDWVYDGKISPFDSGIAVLATAHNEVVKVAIDEDAHKLSIQEVISPARPILYAAEITWLHSTSVLMAAGTAFGEILVWKCHFSESKHTHEMLHVFTGHEGSIFGVCISPSMILPGRAEEVRLLASCSDDRTVRIWDITDREAEKRKFDFSSARETGFSEMLPNADQPKLEGGGPVAMGMGHLSRIWGIELGEVDEGESMDVWSFGEDSTVWRWKLSFEKGERLKGKLVSEKVLSHHDGKHLWSHATGILDGKRQLATGGADGRVSLIEMGSKSRQLSTMVTSDCQQLCPEAISTTKTKKPEVLGRFEFLSENEVLVVTSTGRLLIGTYTGDSLAWNPVITGDLADEIRQCYALKRITAGIAILGTTTGSLYIFSNTCLTPVDKFPRKIVDVNILNATASSADLLIHTFGTACPYFLQLNTQTGELLSRKAISGLDERFVCTSAAIVGSSLVLGSRHGWISLLETQDSAFVQTQTFLSPTHDAITSITPLPSHGSAPNAFLCTSRDGSYRIYSITLDLISHATLPIGPLIETAFFTQTSPPQLIITGFRGTRFIVWNDTLREERLSVDCGGAHRSFSFYHGYNDDGVMRFAFNRAAKLSIYSQIGISVRPVKSGTHGREIRTTSFDGRYLATGGEDTNIRLYEHHPQSRCLAVLKGHISGLQKVKWLSQPSGAHLLFSSAGMEEFFVWRVSPLSDTTYPGLAVLREGVLEDKSPDGDLRIMDFDLENISHGKDGVLVTMVFSSSALARYTYYPTTGFVLLAKGHYTGSCLTQIKHLSSSTVLTASTDGHLVLWHLDSSTKTFTLQQALRVHQSAVKCLDIIASGDAKYVVTGGDDNSLGITQIKEERLEYVGVVRRAHAASINGLLTRVVAERVEVTTVSNDQRIKTWFIELGADQGKVRLLENVNSGVADPGDVEELGEGRVAVAGVGVEVWGRQNG